MDIQRTVRIVIDATKAKLGGAEAEVAMKKVDDSATRTAANMDRASNAVRSAGGHISGFARGALAGLVVTLAATALGSSKAAAGLAELAEQLGVTARGLQAYQAEALVAGVAEEALTTALAKFTKTLGEAAEGNDEAIKGFERLGVKILDAKGNLRDTEEVLRETALALSRIEDPARRAALATDAFGKGGQKLMPILGELSRGVDTLADRARAAGLMLSDELIAKLDRMDDASALATKRVSVLWTQLSTPVKFAALEILEGSLKAILDIANAVGPVLRGIERQSYQREYDAAQKAADDHYRSWTGSRGRTPEQDAADARRQIELDARAAERRRRLRISEAQDLSDPFPFGMEAPRTSAPGASNPRGTAALKETESAYKAALKAANDYAEGLRNEAEISAMTDRERAIAAAGIKAESLARAEALKWTEAQIEAYVTEQRTQAALNYDRDQINRQREQQAQEAMRDEQRRADAQAELLIQPFKRASDSIQTTFTDLFERVYSGGVTSFKELAAGFKTIFVRMAAELSSIRLFQALGLDQLFAGGAGNVVGGGGGSLVSGGAGGGFSLGNLFGGGSLFGSGGAFGFLSNPINPLGRDQVDQILGNGGTIPWGNSVTWGQGLSALGGVASAAQGFMRGGTGGWLQGIGSTIGAGVSLIPGGQAIGSIITGLSAVAGSLLGNRRPRPQAVTNLGIGDDGLAFVGADWTRDKGNVQGTQRGAEATVKALNDFMAANDLGFGAGARGGYLLNSQGKNTGDQWIVGLGPYGEGAQEIENGLTGEAAVERLIVALIQRAADDGKLLTQGGDALSETMLQVIRRSSAQTREELETDLEFAKTYDRLVEGDKTAQATRDAVAEINDQFRVLIYQAKEFGLAVEPLQDAQFDRLADLARNDNDAYTRGIRGYTDPLGLALDDLATERQEALDRAAYLATVSDVLVDVNRLEDYYGRRRAQIVDDYLSSSLSGVQDLITRLTYGDLSLASPDQNLAGLRGEYEATLARAQAGDQTAIQSLGDAGAAYADAANAYYGGNTQAAAIRARIAADASGVLARSGGASISSDVQPLLTALLELIELQRAGNATAGETAAATDELVEAIRNSGLAVSGTTAIGNAA